MEKPVTESEIIVNYLKLLEDQRDELSDSFVKFANFIEEYSEDWLDEIEWRLK